LSLKILPHVKRIATLPCEIFGNFWLSVADGMVYWDTLGPSSYSALSWANSVLSTCQFCCRKRLAKQLSRKFST